MAGLWKSFAPETALAGMIESELAALAGGAEFAVRAAGLPRRIGRALLPSGQMKLGVVLLERGVWRACDLAALACIEVVGAEVGMELFLHGDRDERLMSVRALPLVSSQGELQQFLRRLQSCNDQALFEAGFVDSNHAARVLDEADWNRAVLKLAFVGVALERITDWEARTNPVLGAMLADLAAERQAAGRPVWAGTNVVLASLDR